MNDFLFRRLWPSWWTGKIGDFAWLFFVPFVVAAILSLTLPNRLRQDKWVGRLAFGLTGILFTMTKGIPVVRDFVAQSIQLTVGIPVSVIVDPTDLIALAALFASAWLWHQPLKETGVVPQRSWIVIPLVALVILSDAAAPDYGIHCFALQDQKIQAVSAYWTYTTSDGGLSWQAESGGSLHCTSHVEDHPIIDPNDPNIVYRFSPGAHIERSSDGGNTWETDFNITPDSEAQQAFYSRFHQGSPIIQPGPLDAIGDPMTGNILFAMGHEGVLVRKADASWVWVGVGNYERVELSQRGYFIPLLSGEILLSLEVLLLLLGTWGRRLQKKPIVQLIVLILGWGVWGINVIFFPPAVLSSYTLGISQLFTLVAGLLIVPTSIVSVIQIARNAKPVLYSLLGRATLAGVLFFLPYGLWGINVIPKYTIAVIFALILVGASGISGFLAVAAKENEI